MFILSSTAADATAAATIVHSSSPALLLLFVRVTAAAAVVVFAFLILVRDALVRDPFVVLVFALLVLYGRRRCCFSSSYSIIGIGPIIPTALVYCGCSTPQNEYS